MKKIKEKKKEKHLDDDTDSDNKLFQILSQITGI